MMSNGEGTLDDAYFEWLYSQVGAVRNRNPSRSYWKLLKQLYTKEFQWFIPNDDNRVEDGKELRLRFLEETGYTLVDPRGLWMNLGCSMLEMMIALARMAAFESDGSAVEWFWRFMHNLEIEKYSDARYDRYVAKEVEEVLNRVIHRKYDRDGVGGLFPLRNASRDQRRVELWYQMSSYLLEGLYHNHVARP